MSHKTGWSRVAGIYDAFFMKNNATVYQSLYALLAADLNADMDVLELAAGTGLVTLNIAAHVRSVTATDFSPAMIAEARKKPMPANVSFGIADATALPYADQSFDAVVITNALHIIPRPEKALAEIRRVLKPDGILAAPNFTYKNGLKQTLLSRLMSLAGLTVHARWTPEAYLDFLCEKGFALMRSVVVPAVFPLVYATARAKRVLVGESGVGGQGKMAREKGAST